MEKLEQLAKELGLLKEELNKQNQSFDGEVNTISTSDPTQASASIPMAETVKGEDKDTKHDRCAKEVQEKSPNVKNPHAVCVAAGIEPDAWGKSLEKLETFENGQWKLHKIEENVGRYHIHKDGYRITDKPMSLKEINTRFGSTRNLENSGHILRPVQSRQD